LFFDAPRVAVVRDVEVGEAGPGEVVARALCSGVSQGSELLVYRGEAAAAGATLDASLGAAGYPLRYGYAWVGEVQAIGPGVSTLAPGSRVFAFAPHQTHWRAPADAFRTLPAGVPAERCVLAANLETAVNAIWDSGVGLGDQVAVLGQGVVGLLVTMLAQRAGAQVTALDPAPRRAQAAAQLGARVLDLATAALPEQAAGFDVVFEATGDPQALDLALHLAGFEARVVVLSNYGTRRAPVDLGPGFHRRRLQLISSQVSTVASSRRARWDPARRFALVCSLLAALPLDALLEPTTSLDDLPALFARLDRPPDGTAAGGLQQVVRYELRAAD
jgi:2-desacetyl-2-hydroxyethyl bacteriochlorophyllide A dehydrogenase